MALVASYCHNDRIFIARRLYLKVHSLDSEIQSDTPEDKDDLTNVGDRQDPLHLSRIICHCLFGHKFSRIFHSNSSYLRICLSDCFLDDI